MSEMAGRIAAVIGIAAGVSLSLMLSLWTWIQFIRWAGGVCRP